MFSFFTYSPVFVYNKEKYVCKGEMRGGEYVLCFYVLFFFFNEMCVCKGEMCKEEQVPLF